MLTKRTINAITLLLEQSNLSPLGGEHTSMDTCERSDLQSRLSASGLLNESGLLVRPLESISLFDVLTGLNDTLHVGCKEGVHSPLSHSLDTLNKTFSIWLKSIKLNEL